MMENWKNKINILFFFPVLFFFSGCSSYRHTMVEDLRCEYVRNPVGMEVSRPRLSWKIISAANGQRQTAYQIIAATTPGKLNEKDADLWNTGKVVSDQSIQVSYAGKDQHPRMQVWWKVRVWDRNGHYTAWSAPAHWETGLHPGDWQAQWTGSPHTPGPEPGGPNPAYYFRKEISLPSKPVKARVYISGLGYYLLYINGQKVGDHVLSPNHSNYDYRDPSGFDQKNARNMSTRVYYETFDITPYLQEGSNALAVCLGNGWYFQNERPEDLNYSYGLPRFIAQFEITAPDSTIRVIVSDTTWRTSTGPLIYNGIYTGDIYDARLEMPGWNRPGFDDSQWGFAVLREAPSGRLTGQIAPPDREIREVHPVQVKKLADSLYRFDLGEMISGRIRLKVQGSRGSRIILKYIEEMGPQYGQTDTYILKGEGTEIWEPVFTWHGFRYVEAISSIPLDSTSITGIVVNTDVKQTGKFHCTNALFNRINENYIRTQQGNMHGGITSDCPHRERRGYTGDGQIAAPAALCNFDMSAFYTKWINDIADAQNKENGYVPNTAPYQGGGGGTPWGSAYVILPWYMYLYYGDATILRQHYEGMKKWIAYLQSLLVPPGIIDEKYLGEWVPPAPTAIPPSLVSTAYYYHDLILMRSVAGILGQKEDSLYFSSLATTTKKAFNDKYFHKDEMSYSIGYQGANVFPLVFGLVPEKYINGVFRTLTRHIVTQTNGHFDTGMMGTPLLLEVLTRYGRPDLAYTLMNQKDFPSFGLEIARGATTLWETWNGAASHSHPMFGSVCQWFYGALAGINPDPRQPGYRHVIIRPRPVKDLHAATATVITPYGPVTSSWEQKGNDLVLEVSLPPNTTATVTLPATDEQAVQATGEYQQLAKGIAFKGIKDQVATWDILSGKYRFVSPNAVSLLRSSMLSVPWVHPGDTLLFNGDTLIIMMKTEYKQALIRYTLDGTEPDSLSPLYEHPVRIDKNTCLKARIYSPEHRPGPVITHHYSFVDRNKNGLHYNYYPVLVQSVKEIPALKPAAAGRIYDIGLDEIPYNKDRFALLITGWIEIPKSGDYTFYLTSNDGSSLTIDGRLVIDNDGGHGALEKGGHIHLTTGRHRLRIGYFQLGGGYFLGLDWKKPGSRKEAVPPDLLFHTVK